MNHFLSTSKPNFAGPFFLLCPPLFSAPSSNLQLLYLPAYGKAPTLHVLSVSPVMYDFCQVIGVGDIVSTYRMSQNLTTQLSINETDDFVWDVTYNWTDVCTGIY